MKHRFFKKYIVAVYLVVFTMAIIAFLLAYFQTTSDIWQQTWLNLATELLGVVLVFFIVQYFFSIEELDTNSRINLLLEKLENKDTPRAEDFFGTYSNIDDLIRTSKKMKILGVTLTVFVDKGMSALKETLRNGAKIKILLIDGSTESIQASTNRSGEISKAYYDKKLATTMDNLDSLIAFVKSSKLSLDALEIRTINYPPTVGIEIFDYQIGDSNSGLLKVEIYSNRAAWDKTPIFMINKNQDFNWFQCFNNQFDEIWNKAKIYTVAPME